MARACASASRLVAALVQPWPSRSTDHPVLGRELGGHPVEPVHRAGEAVYEDDGRSVLGSVLSHVHVVAVDADEVPDPSSLGARWVRHGGYDGCQAGSKLALIAVAIELFVRRGAGAVIEAIAPSSCAA